MYFPMINHRKKYDGSHCYITYKKRMDFCLYAHHTKSILLLKGRVQRNIDFNAVIIFISQGVECMRLPKKKSVAIHIVSAHK